MRKFLYKLCHALGISAWTVLPIIIFFSTYNEDPDFKNAMMSSCSLFIVIISFVLTCGFFIVMKIVCKSDNLVKIMMLEQEEEEKHTCRSLKKACRRIEQNGGAAAYVSPDGKNIEFLLRPAILNYLQCHGESI